ncbi:LysR family transcriptional regulator [Novosphingobium colocasiae]|uniref:LysR family transcriptional regulator n=1 Tax=Novosphingobium colocasiae TaxID=1256513 RepID=A0A918PIW3_9SPHN|nr:LysR family transcriptional regulator [Novosphingobium colocasiae]GGZ11463.1 LysR family transcriptional regulator [Novosphingobium colocasiae]
MQLQHLRYFTALARERHFASAAATCGVSQPTLSAGLVALEQELGKRLVDRDRRFIGLTEQGVAILPWAEQVLGAVRGLSQAAEALSVAPQGEFRLAAIPAALALVGRLGDRLLRDNPGLTLSVHSDTAREIQRGLAANAFDAGVTYLDHEPAANVLSVALHEEQYLFVARKGAGFEVDAAVSWKRAAGSRLCLLHQGMQFRRILDRHFAEHGLSVIPAAIADSYVSLLSLVRSGGFTTIVPASYAQLMAGLEWCRFLPFAEPAPARRVGLVVVGRDPLGPMAGAALLAAQAVARDNAG